MIEKYEIKDEILYLYLDYSYEFSSELNILNKVSEYIKNMKIKFNGKKIVLIVGGIALATILYNPSKDIDNNKYIISTMLPESHIVENGLEESKTEVEKIVENTIKQDNNEQISTDNNNEKSGINMSVQNNNESIQGQIDESTSENIVQNKPDNYQPENNVQIETEQPQSENNVQNIEQTVTIYRSNGTIINLSMTDYLIGVLGAEMPASFNIEALKAGVIVSRTYALRKINDGIILTDTVSTQAYNDNDQLRSKWGSEFDKYYNKIKQAVVETDKQVITYNGQLIDALFFSTSNGYTESAKEVFGYDIPYLQSVESIVDKETTPYLRTIEKETMEILNILGITDLSDIEVISRTSSGRVKEIRIGGKVYTGIEIRNLLGLRSTDFDITINGDKVSITTRGYGHGVGMSQYGANKLANQGYSYSDIINHYYTNVAIEKH